MRFVGEYREADSVMRFAEELARIMTRPWTVMEVCGGQTHSIVKYGIDRLIPEGLNLIHGPGCPVCVTPTVEIDRALLIARRPEVVFTTFGDMLRVPGSAESLASVRARGADVRIVYSPLDALKLARALPDREVVFFGVGFETTAPITAAAVKNARDTGCGNFSLLVSHVLVPPAMEAILAAPGRKVQGFLAAGHVCTIMGYEEYFPLAARYRVPIIVTGFEPLDIMQGIRMLVLQLERGSFMVENQYTRSVRQEGNLSAIETMREVFEVCRQSWRGLGPLAASGLRLRAAYAEFDAVRKFGAESVAAEESPDCAAGEVLQGLKKPFECAEFGRRCTPEAPLGAPMVSTEGACAAYYRYHRRETRTL